MATRRELDAAMRAHGATLDTSVGLDRSYNLDAPAGRVWVATGTHWVAHHTSDHTKAEVEAAYGRMVLDMKMGTEPCTETDCEICEEES